MSITKKRGFTVLLVMIALAVGSVAIWYFGRQFTEQAALQRINTALGDLRGQNTNGFIIDWTERVTEGDAVILNGVTVRQNNIVVLTADHLDLNRSGLSLTLKARNVAIIRGGFIARTPDLLVTGLRQRFLRAVIATLNGENIPPADIAASLDGVVVQAQMPELAAPEYISWSQATARRIGFSVSGGRLRDIRIADLATGTISHESVLHAEKASLDGMELARLLAIRALPSRGTDLVGLLHDTSINVDKIRLTSGPAVIDVASLSGDVSGPYLRNLQMHLMTMAMNDPDQVANFPLRRMAQSGQPGRIALFTLDQINTEQLAGYLQRPEGEFSVAAVVNGGFDVNKVQLLNADLPQIITMSSFIYTRAPDRTEDVQIRSMNLDLATLAVNHTAVVAALPAVLFQELSWRSQHGDTANSHRLQMRVQHLGSLTAAVGLTNLDFSTSGISRPDPEAPGRVDYSMKLEDRGLIEMIERINRQHRIDIGHRIGLRLTALLRREGATELIDLPERIQAFVQSPDKPLEFSLSLRLQDSNGALSVQRVRVSDLPPNVFD